MFANALVNFRFNEIYKSVKVRFNELNLKKNYEKR